MTKRAFALAVLALLAACDSASEQPEIAVEGAWARATAAGQTSSAVYLTVTSEGGKDRLVSVSSPVGQASLHSTTIDNGVMRMRPLENLEIPADATVEFGPHGTHIMLSGLEAPIEPGSTVPLTLVFERFGERRIGATARPGHGARM